MPSRNNGLASMTILVILSCNGNLQGHLTLSFFSSDSSYHTFVLLIGLDIENDYDYVMAKCSSLLALGYGNIDADFVIVH